MLHSVYEMTVRCIYWPVVGEMVIPAKGCFSGIKTWSYMYLYNFKHLADVSH